MPKATPHQIAVKKVYQWQGWEKAGVCALQKLAFNRACLRSRLNGNGSFLLILSQTGKAVKIAQAVMPHSNLPYICSL